MATRVIGNVASQKFIYEGFRSASIFPIVVRASLATSYSSHLKGVNCTASFKPFFPNVAFARSFGKVVDKDDKATNVDKALFDMIWEYHPRGGMVLNSKVAKKMSEFIQKGAQPNISFNGETVVDMILDWPYFQRLQAIDLIKKETPKKESARESTHCLLEAVKKYEKSEDPKTLEEIKKLIQDGASIDLPISLSFISDKAHQSSVRHYVVSDVLDNGVRKKLYKAITEA